jgi:hypothetical protein
VQTRVFACLICAVSVASTAGYGQDVRKMEFVLRGTQQQQLQIEIKYHDPKDIDRRLQGSRVLPFSLSATNVSSAPARLDYGDIRLNLNGSRVLDPADPAVVADEIRKMNGRYVRLLNFLASQSSTFHRSELEKRRLRDGLIRPGEKKEGFIFFLRPAGQAAEPFNGVMWLEPSGYLPQALETKDVAVKVSANPSMQGRITEWWQEIMHGPPPYKKSYALLIGIGKYRHWPPLSSPALDVKKMKKFLDAQGFDEVIVLEDENVTRETFRFPQKYFNAKIQPDDRFLFYYSGHGFSAVENGRPRGYLPLVNEEVNGHSNSIPMDEVVSWVKRMSAQHLLVIMDACFSGLAVPGPETHGADRTLITQVAAPPAKYLLMAGNETQESIAHRKWNGSLFTEMIIRGVERARFQEPQFNTIVPSSLLYVWVRLNVSEQAREMKRELTPLLKDLADGVSRGQFVFFRQ